MLFHGFEEVVKDYSFNSLKPSCKSGLDIIRIDGEKNLVASFGWSGSMLTKNFQLFNLKTNETSLLKTTGEIPSPRYAHIQFKYKNKIYLFFGFNITSYFDSGYVLDLETMKWRALEVGPSRRHSASYVIYDDYLYIFGGRVNISKTRTNDVWRFDLEDEIWEEIECKGSVNKNLDLENKKKINNYVNESFLPCKRSSHVSSLIGDQMFMGFGVDENDKSLNDFWSFNLNTHMWVPLEVYGDIPSPRTSPSCIEIGSHIFINGGTLENPSSSNGFRVYYDDNFCFDFWKREWSRAKFISGPTTITPRTSHNITKDGNDIYIFSGESSTKPGQYRFLSDLQKLTVVNDIRYDMYNFITRNTKEEN
ncbi:rab9 effector protein [Anaeramoeba flamelloides]|uniref:Rab9 effector protein n=1 Tax=Anaeramoeba flamelloides TaxID=1746091 RepID=A0AAV7YUT2_9EUKA|nr:rab9 effector protein with kelch motifs [Anaeramoeba flamelloides]KAJ6227294.1 rab9 effector protein [Anaeramoeba flamelloides]